MAKTFLRVPAPKQRISVGTIRRIQSPVSPKEQQRRAALAERERRLAAAQYQVPSVVNGLANARSNLDMATRGLTGAAHDILQAIASCRELEGDTAVLNEAVTVKIQTALHMIEEIRAAIGLGERDTAEAPGYRLYHKNLYGVEPNGSLNL